MQPSSKIREIIEDQRKFYNSGETRPVEFRIQQLKKLKDIINLHESDILSAVNKDMKKSDYEGYIAEIGGTLLELKYALKKIKKWVKPINIRGPLSQFKASGKIYPEPKGVVLIIAPWNYPINLLLSPLVAAISAGNCAVLKPSEHAPHASKAIASIINHNFDKNYIHVIEGGIKTTQTILTEKFDHIFFTGGTHIGKIIMEAASKHLTPITLELGGKSPVIVDEPNQININSVCDYIVSGKFMNCGQTCIAPDYIFVHERTKDILVKSLKYSIERFYGKNIEKNTDYGRIVNETHFNRIINYLKEGRILFGGETERNSLYISPTLIDEVDLSEESKIMNEEIFGPVLPIIEFKDINDVIRYINSKPKSLALYLFTKNKFVQTKVINEIPFGGGCINDTIVHPSLSNMPFGGIGESGMGSYHGEYGFKTFSHMKSIFYRSPRLDLTKKFRFPPHKNKLNLVKRFLK